MPRESTIKIQRSDTAAATPSGLTAGELAVNLVDRKLFIGGTAGSNITFLDASAVVTSFNGITGAVAGVASVNGSTGAVVTYVGTTGNIPYRFGAGVGITANNCFTLQSGDIGDPTDILLLSGVTGTAGTETWRGNTEAIGLRIARNPGGLGLYEGAYVSIDALGKYDDEVDIWGSGLRLTTPDIGGSSIRLAPTGNDVVTINSDSVSISAPLSVNSTVTVGAGGGLVDSDSTALGTTAANQTIAGLTPSYRSAEFFVQASTAGGAYEALKIAAIHDGTNTYNTQYGVIRSSGSLGTYTTILVAAGGGTVRMRLRVTPTTVNTTYKVMITALPV